MQKLVQSKQTALQEAVKDDLVEAEDETAAALKKAGLVATKEQAQALAQALQEKGRTQPMDVDSLESEAAGMDVSALQSLKRKIDEIYVRKEQEARTAQTTDSMPEPQARKEESQGDRRSRSHSYRAGQCQGPVAGPRDGPLAKTHQYTLSSFGNVAAGRTSEPGFAATSEVESADGRSASARRPSYKSSNCFSQVSSSLKYNKPKRQRVKVRSKLLKFCSCYRSWANLEFCYSKWGAIPDSHERFLLKLAEDPAVAEDSNNLEGWTFCRPSGTSEPGTSNLVRW